MSVADVMAPLVEAGLGAGTAVRLTCWDGSETGPPGAPVQLTITSPHALRRLLWAPNQLGFARAYVSGDILIGGDLLTALSALEQVADPEFGLDQAQLAKNDLVSRKLGLEPGMRVIDVGCGWGAFVCNAARYYGVEAVGITLSAEQAAYARRRAIEEGVSDQVEIRVQDYRDVDDGPFDAIASIGMAEHVGQAMLARYSENLFALLSPGGRLLNHAISRRQGPARSPARRSSTATSSPTASSSPCR